MDQNATLGEYSARDWQIIEDQDRLHWAREYRQHGPVATMRASMALWEHLRQVRPEWPTTQDRQEDLDQHLLLIQIFQRSADFLVAG
jgi:hypothetical protein